MEDETPTAEEVSAPGIEATPESGAPAQEQEPGHDWEQRYNELREEFNRQTAVRDRARQGDSEALKDLVGYEFADDEAEPAPEDEENDDPYSTLEQRLAAQEERERQRVEQEGVARFNADLDKLTGAKDLTLSQRERQAVYLETMQNGGSPEALQKVVDGLVEERKAYDKAVIDRWVKSKKNAPFVPPGGTGATEVTDPLDGRARRERLAARLDASGDF